MDSSQRNSQPERAHSTSPSFVRQFQCLCKKSFVLQSRYWFSTAIQTILMPISVVVLIFVIQGLIVNQNKVLNLHPQSSRLKGISKCQQASSRLPCITIMYTNPAENQPIDQIMSALVSQNNARMGSAQFGIDFNWQPSMTNLPSDDLGVVKVPSDDFIYNFTVSHPNITQWAISFSTVPSSYDPKITLYQYQLWYNYTAITPSRPGVYYGPRSPYREDIYSMMRAVDEAIITVLSDRDANTNFYEVYLKEFPDIPSADSDRICPANPDDFLNAIGPLLLFIPTVVLCFSAVSSIANEKKKGLKEAMRIVGLKTSAFWAGHIVSYGWLIVVNAIVTIITGYVLDISLFRLADFSLLLVFFVLYGLASLCFAFFLTGLIPSVKAAVGAALFFTILNLTYLSLSSQITYRWYGDFNRTSNFSIVWKVLMFMPAFNFNKFIKDALSYTSNQVSHTFNNCTLTPGASFGWSLVNQNPSRSIGSSPRLDLIPPPSQSLWLLVMNIVVWTILAYYFDRIIPNENGYAEHPLFFLLPKRFLISQSRNTDQILLPQDAEDDDVVAERETVTNYLSQNSDLSDVGLVISGLHKVWQHFDPIFRWKRKQLRANTEARKVALQELSLSVQKGELLALLGSNGAGKTTAMKILYGSSSPTAGNAWLFGNDIQKDVSKIHQILGVCPQFDVLFPDLTAKEHLELFGGIKGLSKETLQLVSEERLKHMRLWKVRNQRAGQFSGGMRRRLSVIISTMGDPKCLFLDEPTTGMDPMNRQYVWSFLEKFKKDRVIVLTTHSMEEADVLGDKIAIMSQGRLKAVGRSIRLKNKFGSGYRISLVVSRGSRVPTVKQMIAQQCPDAVLEEEEFFGNITSPVNTDDNDPAAEDSQMARLCYVASSINVMKKLILFLGQISENKENDGNGLVSSFGVSQTTLEDVFIQTVRK